MHQSIQSFKSPSPTGHPPRIWTIEDRFAEPFTSRGQNHVHMLNVRTRFDGQFYYFIVQGKISDRGFLFIDSALTLRHCGPFLLSHLLAKVKSLKHLHVERFRLKFPTPWAQATVKCSGRGGRGCWSFVLISVIFDFPFLLGGVSIPWTTATMTMFESFI